MTRGQSLICATPIRHAAALLALNPTPRLLNEAFSSSSGTRVATEEHHAGRNLTGASESAESSMRRTPALARIEDDYAGTG
jgi:hypothetical protein